jgi:hypothetical protein
VWLTYFDESGDSGVTNSPTRFFVLSCVAVHDTRWTDTLDKLITMRRQIRKQHEISTRKEIKALDIRKGRGPLEPLRWSLNRRMEFFANIMKYEANELDHLRAFAIAIDKQPAHERGSEPRETAWQYAMQRIDRMCQEDDERAIVFPDEGHGNMIKKLMRRIRRYQTVRGHWGEVTLKIPMARVVEDPNDRRSHDSYFTQLADWNAFACHRSKHVDPVSAVRDDLWDLLGPRHHLPVNRIAGGPPGIVIWPRPDAPIVF